MWQFNGVLCLALLQALAACATAVEISLADRVRIAIGQYQSFDLAKELSITKKSLVQRLTELEGWMPTLGPSETDKLLSLLRISELKTELVAAQPNINALRMIRNQFRKNNSGIEDYRFVSVQRLIQRWITLLELGEPANLSQTYDTSVDNLATSITQYQATDSGHFASMIGKELGILALLGQTHPVFQEVRTLYSAPNINLSFNSQFLLFAMPPEEVQEQQYTTQTVGTGPSFTGWVNIKGTSVPRLIQDDQRLRLALQFNGLITAPAMSGKLRRSTIHSSTVSTAKAEKHILFDLHGIAWGQTIADIDAHTTINDVSSPGLWRSHRPFRENLIRNIANKRVLAYSDDIELQAKTQLSRNFDTQAAPKLQEVSDYYDQEIKQTLIFQNAFPKSGKFSSTYSQASISFLESTDKQIGAVSRPIVSLQPHSFTMVLHESAIRNYFDCYMGGKWEKDVHLLAIYSLINGDEPEELWVHDRGTRWAIKLPEEEALTMEFRNGQVVINISTTETVRSLGKQVERSKHPFTISATYQPLLQNDRLVLVRQGDVSVRSTDASKDNGENSIAIRDLLNRKFDALFAPKFHFSNLSFPVGSKNERFNNIKIREVRAEQGWLLLGVDL